MRPGLLPRFFKWLFRQIGGLNLLLLSLLYLTLGCVSFGLAAVVEGLAPDAMLIVVFFSLLTGWLLMRTKLPSWGFGLIGTLLGALGLTLTVGRVGSTIVGLFSSLFAALGQLFLGRPNASATLAAAWKTAGDSWTALAAHFDNWLLGVQAGALVIDPLITAMVWGLALWLMALWAIWWVQRRGAALAGLLPAVAVLGYAVYYTNSWNGILWLVATGGGILLLQAAGHYRLARQRWGMRRMDQVEIEPMLVLSVILLAGGMMLAGAFLPSVSLHKISDSIDQLLHPDSNRDLAESLGLQSTPQPEAVSAILAPTGIHTIGAGQEPARNPVLFISVEGYTPPFFSEQVSGLAQPFIPYYWRAQTYDTYTGHGWLAGASRLEQLPANQVLFANAPDANYKIVTQHVTRLQAGAGTVFAAGELLEIDQPVIALWSDSGGLLSARTESKEYTAVSRIPSASVDQLRGAGSNYPASVLRYLALPDSLPPRVRDLALDLTAGQITPYDRAIALEAYLRHFSYTMDVPAPPSDRDAVDYFLFDLKKGYCDYSASAMVVLARAAGLPARLVLGYSPGAYDEATKQFVVRASNSHAWAEIYFPEFGWVEFEPTPTQPLPERPGQTQGGQAAQPSSGKTPTPGIHLERTTLVRLLGIVLAIAFVLAFILSLPLENWWLSLLPADRALTAIFRRLYRRGRAFGILPDSARTPGEFALVLAAELEPLGKDEKRAVLVASLRSDLNGLTGLYTRMLFGRRLAGGEEKSEAVRLWARLRRGLNKIRR